MRWTERERELRQGALFDVVMGSVVSPLERPNPDKSAGQHDERAGQDRAESRPAPAPDVQECGDPE